MWSNIKLLTVILPWLVVGCAKDTPSDQEECHDYVFDSGEIFDTYITTGIQYARPFFNPHNSDEFVYIRSGTGTFTELVKHKISTGQETVLCNSLMIPGQPQWGTQGWIVFSVLGNTTWKIRDDGTGLGQISPSGVECYDPVIAGNGESFMALGTLTPSGYRPIFGLDGNIVDSVRAQVGSVSMGDFISGEQNFKNGYCRFYDSSEPIKNYGYCKLNNNQTIEKLNSFGMASGEATGACRNNENIYYVRHMDGLYQLNISSHQVDKLMENCQSRYIVSLSMSPDGKNIIYQRIRGHQTTPKGMEIDEQSEIFIYNTITKKETKVLWEE